DEVDLARALPARDDADERAFTAVGQPLPHDGIPCEIDIDAVDLQTEADPREVAREPVGIVRAPRGPDRQRDPVHRALAVDVDGRLAQPVVVDERIPEDRLLHRNAPCRLERQLLYREWRTKDLGTIRRRERAH